MFQAGDFVKGKKNNGYSITNEKMLKGLVVGVFRHRIRVKILEHIDSKTGTFVVDPEKFEYIGHVKPFARAEALGRLKDGDQTSLLEYDLTRADLTGADLTGADLTGADLTGADLTDADLTGADLTRANLTGANLTRANLTRADLADVNLTGADLTGADLADADLTGADLTGADLDYSCWPLWCGSIGVKVDKHIASQLAYHLCALDCDDPEYLKMRNSILGFANQFHRVDECGRLEPTGIKEEIKP